MTSNGTSQATALSGIIQSLDMNKLIAAPLVKIAEAQGELVAVTSDFIKDIGLTNIGTEDAPKYEAVTVDFKAKKGDTSVDINVPILAIVNIPSLSIKTVDIDFTCEVDMMDKSHTEASKTTDSNLSNSIEVTARYGWGPVKVGVKASSKYDLKTTISKKSTNDSSMNTKAKYEIHVTARDEQPIGLQKLIGMLNDCITSKNEEATTTVAPTTVGA